MVKPKFSIIIPVYNAASYLDECLKAVLAQNYTNWEVICVDDGSTDNSGKILDEYLTSDERIHVIHQKNGGVSAARNVGLDIAQGEWIWFVDADDMIHPQALDFVQRKMNEESCDAIRIQYLWAKQKPSNWIVEKNCKCRKLSGFDGNLLLGFFFAACGYIIKREVIGAVRFENFKWSEDSLFMMSVAMQANSLILTDAKLYFYRQAETSATHFIPTIADMNRMYDCQQRIIDVVKENIHGKQINKINSFWKASHNYIYYSYMNLLWTMSYHDRRAMIPRWLLMQKQFYELYPIPLERRIRIQLVRIIRSGRLFHYIIDGQPKVLAYLRAFYAKIINR